MKRRRKQLCSILFAAVMVFMTFGTCVNAQEVTTTTTIRRNTTWSEDTDIYGTCVVNWGKRLTIPENVTVTIHDGGSLQGWGDVIIKGRIIVDAGGHFYRHEYGVYQQTVGPESDIKGSIYIPVLAIKCGSVIISSDALTITSGSAVRAARSSLRPWFEKWNLEAEAELMYMNGVTTNVPIVCPDYTTNPTTDFSRLILGLNASNNQLNLDGLSTYYWIYDSVNGGGKWYKLDGFKLMSDGNPSDLSGDDLTLYNAFAAASRQNEPAPTEDEAIVLRNQVYDTSRDTRNTYNLFIPKNAPKNRPVSLILYTHGGSWISGNKESMDYACGKMTRQGYITADIDYRLFEAERNAATSMNDIMDDMQNCINTIVAQAAELGYTIDSVATSGYSAGGHLALLYAYSRTNSACVPVNLVFEQVGPADLCPEAFAPGVMSSSLTFNAFAQKLIPNYQNMSDAERKSALAEISPISYISPQAVPTIMVYADEDIIVGNIHGAHMNDALASNGIDYAYLYMPRSNHTCEFDSAVMDQFWNTTYQYANSYLHR